MLMCVDVDDGDADGDVELGWWRWRWALYYVFSKRAHGSAAPLRRPPSS